MAKLRRAFKVHEMATVAIQDSGETRFAEAAFGGCKSTRLGYNRLVSDQTFLDSLFRASFLVRLNCHVLIMIPSRKTNPRVEYRLREIQRVNGSVSLAAKFPELKSLTVDLAYFDIDGLTKTGALRYTVNVQHAKSVFSFVCPNGECMGGDFDLSGAVEQAVTGQRKLVEGEIRCEGWRARGKEDRVPCQNLLRYKLSLGYL